MRPSLRPMLLSLLVGIASGCNCNGNVVMMTDDGGGGGDASANLDGQTTGDGALLGDGPNLDGPQSDLKMNCVASGQSCVTQACCFGTCDPTSKTCVANCTPVGGGCASATECCTLTCTANKCGSACKQDTQACAANGDCCSGNCVANVCQPIVTGGCTTLGNSCTSAGACCSKNCQGGLCTAPGGGCNAIGDVCFAGSDCCSGKCVIPNGKTSGTCGELKSGGCTTDGEPCAGCSTCCSRVCAPTMTGGTICQLANGCRLQDNLCYKDSDCCGAAGSGLPGDGLVTCVLVNGITPPVGFCSHPSGGQVCDPVGNVCGIKPSQACGGNAREDCCDCLPPKFNCCKLDNEGVPRCFGGSTTTCPNGYTGVDPCCVKAGDQCAFNAECCDGAPCVPDPMGVLRCGTMCIPVGGVCTSNSDCCKGLPCNVPQGKTIGTCGITVGDGGVTPTDGGVTPTDGGVVVPDAFVCALVGQSCKIEADCCSGLTCSNSTGAPCNGGTNCHCFGIIM